MSNIFQKIFKKSLSKSVVKSESVLGIDIGSSSIKIVQLRKKSGRAILETYGELSLGPLADLSTGSLTNLKTDLLVKALNDLMKESETSTKDAGLAIPLTSSLLFVLELPGIITDKELKNVIPIEARRYVPLPISEVTLDWWVIPQREEEWQQEENKLEIKKTEVLVAAIHNEATARYQEIYEKANLTNGFFELEIFSSIRSTMGHDLAVVLLADFGASKTKLAIVDNGIIKKTHIINKGSFDITFNLSKALDILPARAEEQKKEYGLLGSGLNQNVSQVSKLVTDYIFSEMSEIISDYERKHNKVVSKIILNGGGSMLKGLPEEVFKTFGIEIILGNPFSKIESPTFLAQVLERIGPPFAVATGLALKKLQ